MRAHTVPVSYLANFSQGTRTKKRLRQLWAIGRDRSFVSAIDNLCVTRNYYTASSAEDATLFEAQERAFGAILDSIKTETADLRCFHRHLWTLKLRNRWMLDRVRERRHVLDTLRTLDIGARWLRVYATDAELFTSDDPVLVINHEVISEPAKQLLLLPIAPRLLMVSVPAGRWIHSSETVSVADVEAINEAMARQADRYILMRSARDGIAGFQAILGKRPFHVARGAIDHSDARMRVRVDYPTWNPIEVPFRFITRCIGTVAKRWWVSMFSDGA